MKRILIIAPLALLSACQNPEGWALHCSLQPDWKLNQQIYSADRGGTRAQREESCRRMQSSVRRQELAEVEYMERNPNLFPWRESEGSRIARERTYQWRAESIIRRSMRPR